ncbi:MAG TPA: hypothetical protein DCS73_10830 [Roseburia sp.]|nr:hypothetical protein [Roseburia sp.]
MRKRKMLIGVLTAAMLLGNVSPAMVQGAQAADVTEVPAETEMEELATESAVTETEGEETTETAVMESEEEETTENAEKTADVKADENGFIIEDGELTGYTGPGGDIVIPEGVKEIAEYAFYNCNTIKKICFPKSFTDGLYFLNYGNFENLEWIDVAEGNPKYQSLDGFLCERSYEDEDGNNVIRLEYCPTGKGENITIPEGVTCFSGAFAYGNGEKVKRICLPKSFTGERHGSSSIAKLNGCSNLEWIDVAEGNPEYQSLDGFFCTTSRFDEVNQCNAIGLEYCPIGKGENITIPEGITHFSDDSVFGNSEEIKRICLPKSFNDSVDYNAEEAFSTCSNLEWIDVAEGNSRLQSLDGFLCSTPSNASYGEGEVSLVYCPRGKSGNISIPQGVTKVYYGFLACDKITGIFIPASVAEFTKGCNIYESFYYMSTLDGGFKSSNLINYYVDSANENYKAIDGIVYSKDGSNLVAYPSGRMGDVTVSENVKKIENGAFSGCKLNKVNLSDNIKDIKESAFSYAEILEIKWPQTVSQIKHMTFYESKLYEISIPDSVTSFGQSVFTCCDELSIRIPSSVKNIESDSITNRYHQMFGKCYIYCDQGSVAETYAQELKNKFNQYFDRKIYVECIYGFPAKKTAGIGMASATYTVSKYKDSDQVDREYGDKPFDLGAYTNSDAALSYSSDNESVVQVDANGIVTIKGYGYAHITINAPETDNYYGVTKRVSIDVHGKGETQTITASDFTKIYGDAAFSIGAVTDGNGTLSYDSDNNSVATVDANGIVTLTGVGIAHITITASDTETYDEAKKVILLIVNPKKEEANTPSDTETTENTETKPDTGTTENTETKPDTGTTENTETKPEQTTNTDNNSNLITAKNITKTYGCKAFSLGVKSKSGGKLTYSVADKKVATLDKKGKVTVKGYGQTKITITSAAKGKYPKAKKTITLTVKPVKTKIASVKSAKSKNMVVKWKKDTKATGYVIQYSTDKKFKKGVKTVTITKNKTTSKTIGKLKGGKNYYVRVCTYKKSNGKQIKGSHSAVKSVKVKK